MPDQHTLGVIGGGNMAHAIVSGCLAAGVLKPGEVLIAEPDAAGRDRFAPLGVATVTNARELAPWLRPGTAILLAVKPQSLEAAALDAAALDLDRVVISILAGAPTGAVRRALGGRGRIVRAMPNLPAQIGRGATAIATGAGALPGDEDVAVRIFGAVGRVVERLPEELMDAFTAVAGSGPAYVFHLAEAMTLAAVQLGIDAGAADRIVREVVAGAGELLAGSPRAAGDLRSAVTSRGGTTEAALRVLDEADTRGCVSRALRAARDRGRELGGRFPV